MLSMLNTTIHHEMLGPLKTHVDFAEMFIAHFMKTRELRLQDMAQTLYVSSKMLLLHANDMLD